LYAPDRVQVLEPTSRTIEVAISLVFASGKSLHLQKNTAVYAFFLAYCLQVSQKKHTFARRKI